MGMVTSQASSSSFFEQVYELVQGIPEGSVATYGQVAALAGRPHSARYVGYALHSNPKPGIIPCHRVVFRDGSLAPGFAFGGPERQRELLEAEGVHFKPAKGRENSGAPGPIVDLERSGWQA
ncbi:methylated-DNA--protein-cysteine methyltransferase [Bombiscardovia nodaiensis]|uniref:Methylated-DNA--protein-cysteine methyltransferase n=1 Tax=Bombiscardovia nodaiensis TaxID=2932181 RepID=A0ABN6SBI2_9BIFI|nr:methylated-DNA--protein-cysteine methyltransferase [Bombiscardovia nodaiensis]